MLWRSSDILAFFWYTRFFSPHNVVSGVLLIFLLLDNIVAFLWYSSFYTMLWRSCDVLSCSKTMVATWTSATAKAVGPCSAKTLKSNTNLFWPGFLGDVMVAVLTDTFLDALASLDFTLVSQSVSEWVIVSNLGAFKPVYIRQKA